MPPRTQAASILEIRRFDVFRIAGQYILPFTFLKTSSNVPGFFERSVEVGIHRVFGKEAAAGGCCSEAGELFVGSIELASPELVAILN